MLRRITKREAFKLFTTTDTLVYFCPCKMWPEGPWSSACPISGKEYLEDARAYEQYDQQSPCWKGTVEQTAWDLAYNNWAFYNTCHEMGYYAHYYVQR